jgi:cephalosporin hydroxylase
MGDINITRATMRHAKGIPWRGYYMRKHATDLIAYADAIFKNKPDFIIETGTATGASALFFADMMNLLNGKGQVITIDIGPVSQPEHPNVKYIIGSSLDKKIIEYVKSLISGKVMVVLDSSHRNKHVARELQEYSPLVTSGQYLVVEDVYVGVREYWPFTAVKNFVKKGKFKEEDVMGYYMIGFTRGGWLKKNG